MTMQRSYGRRDNIVHLDIDGGIDGVLEDIIIAAGIAPDTNTRVHVTLRSGQCWGASAINTYGMTTGDLTQWKYVDFDASAGRVTGRGGAGGAKATQAANIGENGGHAVEVTTNIGMSAASQAQCLGGGGGAGSGGGGGTGSQFIWGSEQFVFEQTYFRNPTRVDSTECVVRWNNVEQYQAFPGIVSQITGSDGREYRKGSLRISNPADWGGQDLWYGVQQGNTIIGNPGDGGFGGRGAGPCVEGFTFGDLGTSGTYGAGAGGAGGTGGDLTQIGGAGTNGVDGNIGSGHAGGAGGQPGLGIFLNGGTIIAPEDVVDFVGPDIEIPMLQENTEMAPIDVTANFRGNVTDWALAGGWPNGLSITDGIISGAPIDTGSFTDLVVQATGAANTADSTDIDFDVTALDFSPTLLYDLPLSDVPVPVQLTEQWPSNQLNDFLLCAKFIVPNMDLRADNAVACRFRWEFTNKYLGITINKASNQMIIEYHDGVTYHSVKWNNMTPYYDQEVEIKAFKSSTRGLVGWMDNVRNISEVPAATPDLSTFIINDFFIGHNNGNAILNEQMTCIQIFTGDMTNAQIESITLCETATTPPPGTLAWMEDADTNVPVNDPSIVRDFSAHKHPKTIFIETNITNQGDAASHEFFLKYHMVFVQPNQMKGGDLIRQAGHQFIGTMWTTPQENEWKNYQYGSCTQGHGVPFIGTTVNAGGFVNQASYGYSYPGVSNCNGGIPAGWFVYNAGSELSAGVGTGNTQFFVNDVSKYQANQYAVIRKSVGNTADDWTEAEHVRIASVGASWVIVERGYLSNPVAHAAGSYLAQHHITDSANARYWTYNVSDFCPVDGNGLKYNQYAPIYQQDHENENISGVEYPLIDNIGTAYDVDFNYLRTSLADINNDGVSDNGYGPNGEKWHIDGWRTFYDNVNAQDPSKIQVGGTLYSSMSESGGQNGTQMESLFGGFGSSYATKNYSAYMSDLMFREHNVARGPANNHVLFKQDTAVYPYINSIPVPQNAPWRIGMAACMMEGAYMMHQAKSAPDPDMTYDEYFVITDPGSPDYGKSPLKGDSAGCLAAQGWLGDPIDVVRRRVYNTNDFAETNAMLTGKFETGLDGFLGSNVNVSQVTDTQMAGAGSLHATTMLSYSNSPNGANIRTPQFNVVGGKEYTLCFSMKASALRKLKMAIGTHQPDAIYCGPEWRRYVMVFRPESAQNIRAFWYIGQQNTEFWLDEVYLFEGNNSGGDMWERRFDNGIICLNLTNQDQVFDLGGVPYQRILGSNGAGGAPQDPVNNGAPVGNNLIVPSRDAAILVKQLP